MISHLSLPEVVRLTLRRRILNNELPAGERLIEASLAAEFGVSRTTLRAALMELKNDRLVEFSPRRGCSVARITRAERVDMADIVESDPRLHSLSVEASGRARLSELWHALDGQMGALIRSSLEFQGSDLSEVVDRHRQLVDAMRTRDRAVMAEAIRAHY